MRKLYGALVAGLVALTLTGVVQAQPATTFVIRLSPQNETSGCTAGEESGARGVARVRVNAETGEIAYRVVARKLPGTIAGSPGAHIHVAPAGVAGPIVAPLDLTGREKGLVAKGTITSPELAAAILANPENYYVNVHTTVCPGGVIRGQFG
ncbi:MAG: CHRD domain-containing protein [Actinomycetota bacterium]|nr:CHRD domain-containing protein [Actinomycetota bacterium]